MNYSWKETIEELISNWRNVLDALNMNGLELKSTKTLVTPKKIPISASKHKLPPLISCEPPATVTAMRWFIDCLKTH